MSIHTPAYMRMQYPRGHMYTYDMQTCAKVFDIDNGQYGHHTQRTCEEQE